MDKMSHCGYKQGDMTPKVEDYQRPSSTYAEHQFGTTTEYISRQDRQLNTEAKQLRNNAYKGRYS